MHVTRTLPEPMKPPSKPAPPSKRPPTAALPRPNPFLFPMRCVERHFGQVNSLGAGLEAAFALLVGGLWAKSESELPQARQSSRSLGVYFLQVGHCIDCIENSRGANYFLVRK